MKRRNALTSILTVALGLTPAEQAAAAHSSCFKYEGKCYVTAAEVCAAAAKIRHDDTSVNNPYDRVLASKDDGDSVSCKLGDKSGNDAEQHYGDKVTVEDDAQSETAPAKKSSTKSTDPADGKWLLVERRKGEWLTVQSVVSGQPIIDRGAEHAMIQEYYLNGGEFDGYKDGRLFEVKGDYEGLGWMLAANGVAEAAAAMRKKEEGFRAQARKLVETAAKYKLTPVYVVKKNQIDYWTGLLAGEFPEIEWRKWDRVANKIVYPAH